MAKFERLIPHILKWETKIAPDTWTRLKGSLPELFAEARKKGYACLKGDSGGPTVCGVTIGTYTQWSRRRGRKAPTVADLRNISFEDWSAIMRGEFWEPCKGDAIRSQGVANMLVDWAWLSGTRTAIRRAQKALRLTADGIVGVRTLGELNRRETLETFATLAAAREAHMREIARNPAKARFLRGWLNRMNDITIND